jgi:transcriptional regulator with XRE-family HTH domain
VTTPARIFPAMLKALRLHHGLTQRQLAERLDLPQSGVAHHESVGQGPEDVLTRYAAALKYKDLPAMLTHGLKILRAKPAAPQPPDADLMRDVLTRTGWQRKDLATHLGVSKSLVTLVLGGKRKLSADVHARLEALHATTPEDAFRHDDETS